MILIAPFSRALWNVQVTVSPGRQRDAVTGELSLQVALTRFQPAGTVSATS